MKFINKTLLAFSLLIAFVFGCDDVEELNIDPNQPVAVSAENLVSRALFQLPDLYWERDMNFEFGMLLVQHLAQSEYTDEQRYNFQPADFDGEWSDLYAGGLYDLVEARRIIEETDWVLNVDIRTNQLAVIEIMSAFGFQMATDLWGDIPYSEALTGGVITQPAYDTQESIYSDLITRVTTAVSSINTGLDGFSATGDIIFNGNMDAWQKFGNALLLRMGMRIADVNPALASTTVSTALSGNIVSSVADQVALPYRTEEALSNPFWFDASLAGGSRDDFRVSEELLSVLQTSGDPRIAVYADTTATGAYIGMPYGLTDNEAFSLKNSTSDVGDMLEENPTMPAYILKYSEVKFLEAEAIARGFISGDAEMAFNEGVTAAMNEWEIKDEAVISDYLATNPYNSANPFESIGKQLWIALFTNGMEAWATWRRLDQPVLNVPEAALQASIPVRGLYPTDESATNQSNLGAVPYEDGLSTKLWWDVN